MGTGGKQLPANGQFVSRNSPVTSSTGFHMTRKIGNTPMSGVTTQVAPTPPVVYSLPKALMGWNKLLVLTITLADSVDDKRRKNITNLSTITILGLTIGSMILIQ